LSFAIVATAKAQTTNAAFQKAVAAYQQSQNDETAAKVIKMASAMRPMPPIPEAARKHYVRGAAMFKDAQSTDAYGPVINEFKEAVRLAPGGGTQGTTWLWHWKRRENTKRRSKT